MRSLSLRQKMVLSIGAPILVLGVAGTMHARVTLSSISHDELDRRELAIARDLESHSAELLLTNDMFGLYQRVNQLASANGDVRYALVLDDNGMIRASTFAGGVPVGLRAANRLSGGGYSLATLATSEGEVRDLAYPIEDGSLGVIRLGLSTQRIESRVNGLTANLLWLTAAAAAGGTLVSYLLATVLTRPLSRLIEAARAITRGEPASLTQLYRHPEVGRVAVAFDDMTQKLREKEEERSRLLARVMTAQEEERRRISRELHDEAGQALTSLLLGLTHLEQSVSEPEAAPQVAELRSVTIHALGMMRDMARDLRPSTLDDLGLPAALRRYVSDYGRKHAIETHFHSAGFDGTRLRPERETALYRIVQEALTNVSMHAEASSVSVLLERRDGLAVVVVEDDGKGFDVAKVRTAGAPAENLGLLGMEERATMVGGTLTIESRPGAGTAVFVEVPTEVSGDEAHAHSDRG